MHQDLKEPLPNYSPTNLEINAKVKELIQPLAPIDLSLEIITDTPNRPPTPILNPSSQPDSMPGLMEISDVTSESSTSSIEYAPRLEDPLKMCQMCQVQNCPHRAEFFMDLHMKQKPALQDLEEWQRCNNKVIYTEEKKENKLPRCKECDKLVDFEYLHHGHAK